MRILVTNDDGIDSLGLHELARALRSVGDVVVCAPDTEYSGSGASLGPFNLIRPELHRVEIDGVDEAWTITGTPALCVMFASLGAVGDDPFDIVVSGINPGANVGGAVYHSGTVGAALTARQAGMTGVAVSQAVPRGSHLGQGVEEGLESQKWHSAAAVAAAIVGGLRENPLPEPALLNVNVPNLEIRDLGGWAEAEVAPTAVGSLSRLERTPKPGHDGAYHLEMVWGGSRRDDVAETTDVAAVRSGRVALTWLGGLGHVPHRNVASVGESIESLLAATV